MELVNNNQDIKEIKLAISALEKAAKDMFIYNLS